MAIVHSFIALLVLGSVIANPIPNCNTDTFAPSNASTSAGSVLTGLWDSAAAGTRFTLQNNLWGASHGTGSQSSQVLGVSGDSVSWQTTYGWHDAPRGQVLSYSNLKLRVGLNKALASIKSIPANWSWKYTSRSSDLVADVSYDFWLSNVPGSFGATSDSTDEIMFWLSSRGGAGPAGHKVNTTTIDNVSWDIYQGTIQNWNIFSFIPEKEISHFDSDLYPFFTYLIENQGLSSSKLLVQAQGGTEPFQGNATLQTTKYTLAIN